MKFFINQTIVLFLTCSLLISCSDTETEVRNQELNIDLTQLKINLDSLHLGEAQVVFEYQTKKQLKEKSDAFIISIFEEIDGIIKSNSKITNVVFTLKFTKGTAILKDVYVLDAKNETVISDPPSKTDWDALWNGARCPQGWTDNGNCSSSSCVANTTQEILTDPDAGINSSGDCTQIQYNRGLLSVRICSRSCT
jgi:hypothetical protein